MKKHYSHIGLAKLCGWFGITRQAYYQNSWKTADISIEEELVISEVTRSKKSLQIQPTSRASLLRKYYES